MNFPLEVARFEKDRYESPSLWVEGLLAKPNSKELLRKNLNVLMGDKRGENAKLANHVGVDPSVVSNWRTGKNSPEIEKLSRIADYFGLSVAQLFTDPTDIRTTGMDLETALRMVTEAVKKSQTLKD